MVIIAEQAEDRVLIPVPETPKCPSVIDSLYSSRLIYFRSCIEFENHFSISSPSFFSEGIWAEKLLAEQQQSPWRDLGRLGVVPLGDDGLCDVLGAVDLLLSEFFDLLRVRNARRSAETSTQVVLCRL